MITTLITLGIATAGGLGAGARFATDTLISRRVGGEFPWGTAVVNVTGSFLLGIASALFSWTSGNISPTAIILAIGFLGGFTTFSAASFEAVSLILKGKIGAGVTYAVGWLALCVFAAMAGYLLVLNAMV